MSFLFIGSTGGHAGLSLLTWAIGRKLGERGLRVGFMKPVGTQPVNSSGDLIDRDAMLFKTVWNLQDPTERICPFFASEEKWRDKGAPEILEEIGSVARKLSTGKDVLLMMGSEQVFFDDPSHPISDVSLVNSLKADFILLDRFQQTSRSIYSILSVRSLLKERMKAIVLNRVPPEKLVEIRNQLIPSLVKREIPFTAALPEDPMLSFRSLEEIRTLLEGQVLWGDRGLDHPVGGMTVGSADLRGELLLFKRVYNKVILLKPGLSDNEEQAPRAPRSIAGILLTGGRNPPFQALEAARRASIPLLLIRGDTFAALDRLEKAESFISSKDEAKVLRFTELLEAEGALEKLCQVVEAGM